MSLDLHIICAFPPQFEVLAVDSGRPTRTTTADVTVLVTRDEFAPEFISTPYTATITENAAINGTVLTIRATDRDLEVRARVCRCPGHRSSPSPLSLSLCGGTIVYCVVSVAPRPIVLYAISELRHFY